MIERRGVGSSLRDRRGEERQKRRRGKTAESPSRARRGATLWLVWTVTSCSRRVAIDNFNFSEFVHVPEHVLRRTTAKSQEYADEGHKSHAQDQATTLAFGTRRQCAAL